MRQGQPPLPREWFSDDAQAILPSARRSPWGWLLWLGLLAVLWIWMQSGGGNLEPTVAGGASAAKHEFDAATAAVAHPISSLAAVTPASALTAVVTPAPSLAAAVAPAFSQAPDSLASGSIGPGDAASIATASAVPLTPAARSSIAALKSHHARNTAGTRLARAVAGAATTQKPKPLGLPHSPLSLKSKLQRRKHRRKKHRVH